MAQPPQFQTILLRRVSPTVVLLTYNQPHVSNAFTVQSYIDLRSALIYTRDDPEVTVVVVTGAGKHYCAGKILQSPDAGGPRIEDEIAAGSALREILQGFPKVLIAAVNGAAVGWGCTQLANFDLVYASDRAFFQTPFTQLGFAPEGGSSWTFVRTMGKQHAMRFLLGSERVPAKDAYMSGYVTQVLESRDREDFLAKVVDIAKRIGGYNSESLKTVKHLVGLSDSHEAKHMQEASAREREALQRMLGGDGAKQRMAGFAKRSELKKQMSGSESKL